MKKKWISVIFACIAVFCLTMPAFANSENIPNKDESSLLSSEITQLENGDSIITSIYEDFTSAEVRGVLREKSGHKTVDYKTAKGTAFTYTVYGTFRYDGQNVNAINSSDDYSIVQSGWRCTTHNASISGASAKGSATFRHNDGTTKKLSTTLSCSSSGNLR